MEKQGLVSVKRVEQYDPALLRTAIGEHFDRLDIAELVTPATKILLKPNLLTGRAPDLAITTHPAVVQAVADWLREHGAVHILLADSPGGVYTPQRMKSVYKACGLDKLDGVTLNYDTGWQTRFLEDGAVCKSFNLINPVCEADLIINLAKLKTHGMTTMSGGIKNLFGTVPGLQKPELHYRYPDKERFCSMLVDLSRLVTPQVTVIDAIHAMEGEGPSGGTVREMGYLLAARDLYAQDWIAAQAMGLNPQTVEMLRFAQEQGLVDPNTIRIEGDPLQETEPFALPKSVKSLLFSDYVPGPLRKPAVALVKRLLHPVPRVRKDLCIGCGRCAESCPAHTIIIEYKKAVICLDHCISCFCCHEMCPVQAIAVKRMIRL